MFSRRSYDLVRFDGPLRKPVRISRVDFVMLGFILLYREEYR